MDLGALAGAMLILLCVAACFLSVATVLSLTTRNQIVCAISTFCVLWLMLIVGWLLAPLRMIPAPVAEYLSVILHIEDFARGSIEARVLVLYVSATLLALFAAVRMLESRRWRK